MKGPAMTRDQNSLLLLDVRVRETLIWLVQHLGSDLRVGEFLAGKVSNRALHLASAELIIIP